MNWTTRTTPVTRIWADVAFAGGTFVAVSSQGFSTHQIMTTSAAGQSTLVTTEGRQYSSRAFTGSLGTAPYTYQLGLANDYNTGVTGISIDSSGIVTVSSSYIVQGIGADTYSMVVIITDSVGDSTTAELTVVINDTVNVQGGSNILTTYGRADTSSAFTTLYGTAPMTWTIDSRVKSGSGDISEALSGIRIGSSSGLVTTSANSPAGIYTVTIRATDARGDIETTTMTVRINDSVSVTGVTTLITTYSIETSTQYVASGGTTSFTGGTDTYTFYVASITKGASTNIDTNTATIFIDSATGVLTILGTTLADTYTVIIRAIDQFSETGTLTLTLRVNESVSVTGDTELVTTEGRAWSTSAYQPSLGTGPYTYQVVKQENYAETYAGITISTNGIVTVDSAVVAADDTYTLYPVTIIATDSVGDSTTINLLIRVNDPVRIAGDAYLVTTASTPISSDSYTATLGTPDYTFSIAGITRWSGAADTSTISINASNGVVSTSANTPADTYTITVRVTDDRGDIEETTLVIRVNETLTLTGDTTIVTTYSRAITADFNAAGGTTADSGGENAYIFTINEIRKFDNSTIDTVAAGITIDPASGLLSVSETTPADTYTVTLRVTDSVSAFVQLLVTIRVNESVSVTGATTLTTTQGIAIDTQFSASLGTAPYTYQIVTSNLIDTVTGITISETGLVTVASSMVATDSSTPAVYPMTVIVTDAKGDTTTAAITITINPPIQITGDTYIVTTFGRAESSSAYQSSRGTVPHTFSIDAITDSANASRDPSSIGIAMSSNPGYLTISAATPADTYTVIIRVTDDRGDFETMSVTVLVNSAIAITGPTSLVTTFSIAVETTYAATGGTIEGRTSAGDLAFSIQSISAQNNSDTTSITISTNGELTITGTTPADTYTITILATDSLGVTGSLTVSLLVNEAVAATGDTELTTTEGRTWYTSQYIASKGTGSYTYSIATAADHSVTVDGITISDTGVVRVAETVTGADGSYTDYPMVVIITDQSGDSTTINLLIRVNDPVRI
ncbi:MAG: beta strand repeat-containing protein, partial [Candidatus Nanopelagicaceae bacterium]